MSTSPYERIEHWKRREGHIGGRVLHSNVSYYEAQRLEKKEAEDRGCKYAPGGEYKAGDVWSVYHVWGGSV